MTRSTKPMVQAKRILTGFDDKKPRPPSPSDIAERLAVKRRKTSGPSSEVESELVNRSSRHGKRK